MTIIKYTEKEAKVKAGNPFMKPIILYPSYLAAISVFATLSGDERMTSFDRWM